MIELHPLNFKTFINLMGYRKMSKGKSNKHHDNENNFHHDSEVENVIDLETTAEHNSYNLDEFPGISTTVKMTNPGEEIIIHAENIVDHTEQNHAAKQDKKEDKVNILNVSSDKTDKTTKTEKAESGKDNLKVAIVDLTKKKAGKSEKRKKFFSLFHLPFNEKLDLINVKLDDKDLEKALDSLIYVGGGVIAVTSLTSKALANIGSLLIKK